MFEILKEKFEDVMRYVKRTGKIREENIQEALKQIKLGLLEADVNYKVVKTFLDSIKEKVIGQDVLHGVSPSQQFIKIVHDEIENLIKYETSIPQSFPTNKITKILLCGLNGSGKTTTIIKLAKYFKKNKCLIIAADLYRPAAIEQLKQLGKKNNIDIYSDLNEKNPIKLLKEGLKFSEDNGFNLVLIDSAGRMEVNEELMKELKQLADTAKSDYNIAVIDAMTGQLIIDVITKFKDYIKINGAILTKFDSDTKGGAALSLKYLTNIDILFLGIGEKVNDLETFNANSIANRILGMGDIVEFVKKTNEILNEQEMAKFNKKINIKEFDLNDFLSQLKQIYKSGMLNNMLQHLPVKLPINDLNMDDKQFKHVEAIILSMTTKERNDIDLIDLNRKIRIAKGAGRPIEEVTKLIKQFKEMKKMMKKFEKMDIKSLKNNPLMKQFINI